MKKHLTALAVLAVVAGTVFVVNDAVANSAAEEQIYNVLNNVLDIIAEFLDRVFQSIADAVRSVFVSSDTEEASLDVVKSILS